MAPGISLKIELRHRRLDGSSPYTPVGIPFGSLLALNNLALGSEGTVVMEGLERPFGGCGHLSGSELPQYRGLVWTAHREVYGNTVVYQASLIREQDTAGCDAGISGNLGAVSNIREVHCVSIPSWL